MAMSDLLEKIFNRLNLLAVQFFKLKDPSPLFKICLVLLFLSLGGFFIFRLEAFDSFHGALAGAFIGAAVSAVCGFLTSDKGLSKDEFTKILDESLTSAKSSRYQIDTRYIRKFSHLYYHTSDANGSFWMYLKFKDHRLPTPYSICFSVDIPKGKNTHRYYYEAFISWPNLIIKAGSEDHSEKSAHHLIIDYCFKLGSENGGYYGLLSHINWHRKDRINPVLLLEEPFPGTSQIGRQPADIGRKLFDKWIQLADNSLDDFRHLIKEHNCNK